MSTVPTKLLLVESDLALAERILLSLEVLPPPGFQVTLSHDMTDASRQIKKRFFDLILLDISVTNGRGEQYFETLQTLAPRALLVLLYDKKDISIVHQAMEKGASDYVDKSQLNRELLERVINYNLANKHVNNLLRVSIAAFKAIGEACPQGVMVSDLSGNITYTNNAYQRLTGMTAEQLLGSPWMESVYPQDRLRIQQEWRHVAQAQIPFHTRVRMLHNNHTVHFVLVNGAFLHDGKALHGHVRIMEDITPNGVVVETNGEDDDEQLRAVQSANRLSSS